MTKGSVTVRSSNLSLNSVTLIYEDAEGGAVRALDEIDIDVPENEFLVVVGPSGCGKSTLLKLMVGLLRPSAGTIFHHGSPVVDTLRDVGMVYQDPLFLPWRNVLDNILLPVEILSWDRKTYLPIAEEIIDTVGLSGFADKTPRQLSGGMQQRVALCRALITDPSLLLMEEPFAALDARQGQTRARPKRAPAKEVTK